MSFIGKIIITAIAVLAAAAILPEEYIVNNWVTALVVALVLGLLNAIVKPILIILTLPITLLTLGLFLLVINALMIMMADYFIDGFEVKSFWWALALSLFISLINSMLGRDEQKKAQRKQAGY